MLPQLSLFQQCSNQSQDVMQTWLHWRRQDALLVQKHFVALFHSKPNECLRFDLESYNLMCTYIVVTHPCHISPLAQARPMMLCIYTSYYYVNCSISHSLVQPNLLKLHLSQQARRTLLQGRQLHSQSKPLVQSLWATSGSANRLERRVRRMGGRTSLVAVVHFK